MFVSFKRGSFTKGVASRQRITGAMSKEATPKRPKRVLLKLSGEALCGNAGYGLDPQTLITISAELAEVHALGTEIGIVIGGGNIFRGLKGAAS